MGKSKLFFFVISWELVSRVFVISLVGYKLCDICFD